MIKLRNSDECLFNWFGNKNPEHAQSNYLLSFKAQFGKASLKIYEIITCLIPQQQWIQVRSGIWCWDGVITLHSAANGGVNLCVSGH